MFNGHTEPLHELVLSRNSTGNSKIPNFRHFWELLCDDTQQSTVHQCSSQVFLIHIFYVVIIDMLQTAAR